MDPSKLLLESLLAGTAAAVKGVSTDAVQSAYNAVKSWFANSGDNVDLSQIEKMVEDGESLAKIVETLADAGIPLDDPELVALLQELEERSTLDLSISPLLQSDRDSIVELIKTFPMGPAVPRTIIDLNQFASAMEREFENRVPTAFQAVVAQANDLRCRADPSLPEQAIAITGAPNPAFIEGYNYWFQIGSVAKSKGPRMAAALLVAMPISPWIEVGASFFQELETLRKN